MICMIKRILISTVVGCIITVFFVQRDPWVHYQIGQLYKQIFAQSFDCIVEGTLENIDLFSRPHLKFSNFTVKDAHGKWVWQAKEYATGFSWITLFLTGSFDVWVKAEKIFLSSECTQTNCAIAPHLTKLMKGPDLPIPLCLALVELINCDLTFVSSEGINSCRLDAQTRKTNDVFNIDIKVHDGILHIGDKKICEHIQGTVAIHAKEIENKFIPEIRLDMHLDLPHHTSPHTSIAGSFYHDSGRFSLSTADQAIRIQPIIITTKNDQYWAQIYATIPIAYLAHIGCNKNFPLPIGGLLQIKLLGSSDGKTIEGQCISDDMSLPGLDTAQRFSCYFHKKNSLMWADLKIRFMQEIVFNASCSWNSEKQLGNFSLYNPEKISWSNPYFHIAPQDMIIKCLIEDGRLKGSYNCYLSNRFKKEEAVAYGTIEGDAHVCDSHGRIQGYTYQFQITDQFPYIALCEVRNEHGSQVQLQKKDRNLEATIDVNLFKTFLDRVFGFEIQGEGQLALRASEKENNVNVLLDLINGTIRLPHTYNFVDALHVQTNIDFQKRHIDFIEGKCGMHTGTIRCDKGHLEFSKEGKLNYAHIPLVFDHCLFNLKRDLFTMLSGALLFKQLPQKAPLLSGHILLDRSQLKENIFSNEIQKKLVAMMRMSPDVKQVDLHCDLTIETKEPIKVDTEFLKATAQAYIHCHGSLQDPHISGTISIISGSLNFPYKPLQIHKGKITIDEQQPFNPSINLLAKNSIKKHGVTLQVSGTLENHFVLLESSPPLTEEHIVSLLLAGAHDESLGALVPALLMHNITNVLFSADQSGIFQRYMRPWMKQFRVQFLPRLSSESGRGGLRGSIEISIDDRWRALIEKNFSLTEDTRFELEYILSDDVSFRVIRDERCDIGGEVEMRWKF